MKLRRRHFALEFFGTDDFAEEGIGREQYIVIEEDVVNPHDAFITQDHIADLMIASVHRQAQAKMRVVIQIRTRRNNPINEAGFNQRNQCRDAQSRRRERACQRDADGHVVFEHTVGKKLRAFAQTCAVVSLKGRFDELFFVDLPNQQERDAIWRIVVGKYNRDPNDLDVQQLSRICEGLTGAEIEALYLEAMFAAFERGKDPTDLDIASALNCFVPLSKLMADSIAALKLWAKGRARPATLATPSESCGRKLVV